jgi:ketosteroid isomerase-like protein
MKSLRLLPLLLVLHLGVAVAASAAEPERTLSRAEKGLRDAELKRFDALVAADMDALGQMMADELTFTHATGVLQTKAELMKDLASGALRYRKAEVVEQHIRIHGVIGIINGVVKFSATIAGTDRELNLRYTGVYVRRVGRWQLLAWQSTQMPQ